jgi:hypothetical protein
VSRLVSACGDGAFVASPLAHFAAKSLDVQDVFGSRLRDVASAPRHRRLSRRERGRDDALKWAVPAPHATCA